MENDGVLPTTPKVPPLVSVIVPVYNTEKYLRQCLDSIIGQTEPNIEIICVDDGSPDSSFEILEEYRAKDSRVVVIKQENGGVAVARNVGVSRATGKYLFFADSDDELSVNLCRETVETAEKYDSQIVLTYDDGLLKRMFRRLPQFRSLYDQQLLERGHSEAITPDQRRFLAYFAGNCACWYCLYRRDFWLEQQLEFPKGIRISEDLCVNFRAFAKTERVALLNARLYYYRRRTDSASHKIDRKKLGSYVDKFEVFRRTRNFYLENVPYLQDQLMETELSAWRQIGTGLSRQDYQIWKSNVESLVDDSVLSVVYQKGRLPFKVRQFWLTFYGRSVLEKAFASLYTRFFDCLLRSETFYRSKIRPFVKKRG